MEPARIGIPQGLLVSPILFLFFNIPLIKGYKRLVLLVQTGGFVDDIYLLAYSKSTERNCQILEKAYRKCARQAAIYSATFAPAKYNLVHLTRKPKKVNLIATVRLGTVSIQLDLVIRVLGLQVDTKIRQGLYLVKMKAKIVNQKRALACISASIQGVTLQKVREVYRAVITLILIFAALIQYILKNLKGASEKHVDKLTVIQNNCLRIVLGAYRVTPVQVLEAEADIFSIRIQLDKALLGLKALRGTHLLVQEGNRRIRRKLQPKRGRRITPLLPLSQEKEAQAARYLGVGP